MYTIATEYNTVTKYEISIQTSTSVGLTYIHTCRSYVYMRVGVARALADLCDFGLLGEQNSHKMSFPNFDANEPPSKM